MEKQTCFEPFLDASIDMLKKPLEYGILRVCNASVKFVLPTIGGSGSRLLRDFVS